MIQSILFDKTEWTPQDAVIWLKHHHKIVSNPDITHRFIRYRQQVPNSNLYHYVTHMIPGEGIDLILAYPKATGGSLTSFIKSGISKIKGVFTPYKAKTGKFKNFLEEHKNDPIVSIKVARMPVQSGVRHALNVLSFGRFNKKVKELNYNNIYHNFLLVTLKSGKTYRVQQDHVQNAKPAQPRDFEDTYDIPLHGKQLNVKQLIENANHDVIYDGRDNNCQKFVKEVLDKNGLNTGLPKQTEDIIAPQKGRDLINTLGPLKHVALATTHLANVVSHTTGIGSGFLKPREGGSLVGGLTNAGANYGRLQNTLSNWKIPQPNVETGVPMAKYKPKGKGIGSSRPRVHQYPNLLPRELTGIQAQQGQAIKNMADNIHHQMEVLERRILYNIYPLGQTRMTTEAQLRHLERELGILKRGIRQLAHESNPQ